MLTRCTHCDTAFRITPEDLALARGRVRCGQCMRTFDALQKLTDEKEQQQLGYGVEYSGESKDIGQPQNIVEPEDIGEPQHAAEPEDIGEPQHAAEPEDIGEPEDVAQLEDVDKTNHTAQSVAGDAWITDDTLEHGKVDADVMELHGLSYGDLDEELLNTHTMPAIPGLVEHPDFGFNEEPTPEPENTAQEKLPLSWDDSWDEMSFDDEHGIPLNDTESEHPSTWMSPETDSDTSAINEAQACMPLDPEADTQEVSLDELAETFLMEESGDTSKKPGKEQAAAETDEIADSHHEDISVVQAELEDLAKLVQSEPAQEGPDEPQVSENFDQVVKKRRSGAAQVATGLMALILALGLGAQLVHYYRESLLPHPTVGPVLKQAYQKLGVTLPPEWKLDRYDVRQLGGVQNPARPGVLIIGISIRNQAGHSQPYPIIRLVLEDRWGDRIAKSDIKPGDYLAEDAKPGVMMRAGQMIKTDIAVMEPEGVSATNFQIDACMPNEDGTLNCANKL